MDAGPTSHPPRAAPFEIADLIWPAGRRSRTFDVMFWVFIHDPQNIDSTAQLFGPNLQFPSFNVRLELRGISPGCHETIACNHQQTKSKS